MAWRNQGSCFVCNRRSALQQMSRIDGDDNVAKRDMCITRREALNRPFIEITNLTRICINCNQSVINEIQEIERNPTCIRLNVLTQTSSHTCVICNAAENVNRISFDCRINVFILHDIYIPEGVRACEHHLDDRGFFPELLLLGFRFINRPYIIKGPELQRILQALRHGNVALNRRSIVDENSLTDEEFHSASPVTKEQFRELYEYCSEGKRCAGGRRYISRKDLLMFLCKMRQGLPDDFLQLIFYYSSRQAVSLAVATVRQCLMTRFVPENIGFDAITRDEYITQHVNDFANTLYNPEPENRRVIAVIDGIYSYIPKSSNFRTLRQTFSVHKSRHLLQPVLVVAPNGYILEIQGPYFSDGRNNDASILQNEFNRDAQKMRAWFNENNIVIIDRGYRDATELLTRLGIIWKMPALLPRGRRQLSTEEANDTRLITKIRWVVEARNGHLKSVFKFLQLVLSMHHLPHLGDFYRICGAIINRYHSLLEMQNANEELARYMLARSREANAVQQRVELENLATRNAQRWLRLDANRVNDFPALDLDDLQDITIGVYQVHLAPSYVQDKLQREGDEEFQIEMLRDHNRIPERGFLRVRVYSRFRRAAKHQLWISYRTIDKNVQDDEDDADLIRGYYCTCKSGARTLGTCAHITSVLYYLGYAQHQQHIRYPSTRLLEVILDAANRPPP